MIDFRNKILEGDVLARLKDLPNESVNCVITSPPYWGLRDYEVEGQIGQEATPQEFVAKMVEVFNEVWRVLRDDGTLWLNLGDTYNNRLGGQVNGIGKKYGDTKDLPGHERPCRKATAISRSKAKGLRPKSLVGIPWRVAIALMDEGWILRSEVIWHKLTPMPESVTDRPTRAHETVFLFSKQPRYHYDADAIREPLAPNTATTFGTKRKSKGNDAGGNVKSDNFGRRVPIRKPKLKEDGTPAGANKRTVWPIASARFPGAHFATFPPALVEPCIKAGCPTDGVVLDPFFGAGTTGLVAKQFGRNFVGIELNPEYVAMAKKRLYEAFPLLMVV